VKKGGQKLQIDQKQALIHLFKDWSGKEPQAFEPFPQSGSNRTYCRIRHEDVRAVGVCNDDHRENKAFVEMTRFFLSERIRVPALLGEDLKRGVYLIQDLGDQSLFHFIIQHRGQKSQEPLLKEKLRQVIRELARIQVMAGRKMDFSICYPYRQFSRESIIYDLHYFRQQFLDQIGQSYQNKSLEAEFKRFADYILQADQDYFMYRDFQSRNIMLFNGEPWFIDYQGGRKGPLQYDLAAFLYQARAGLPEELRVEMMEYYLQVVRLYTPVDERAFHQFFYPIVLLRVFQTLGAYGLRGLKEGKEHFIQSIPHALENLRLIGEKNPILLELPQLRKIVHQLTQKKAPHHGTNP
jgi:aminoglycoside/choline kinase family phosphotransferase